MSKPNKIADHEHAVSAYIKELLDDGHAKTISKSKPNLKKEPFEALLIDIQGLQIAIPTHYISGIVTWPHKTSPEKTHSPDWYIADYKQAHQTIRVVNTSQIIFPSDYSHTHNSADFIIVIADEKWGLSCNKVNNITTLSPDIVTWRENPGQRAWLAGVIPKQNCSILNIDALIQKLESEFVNI